MKKLKITIAALTGALCATLGAFYMTDVNAANAETGVTPTLSATKVMLAKANDKMLLATAIKDKADVYEVGYTFGNEVETIVAEKGKYYTSIGDGSVTLTAGDIFEEEWAKEEGVGMIIWEIEFGFDINYAYKAYAKVGERNDEGQLVLPEEEVVVTPVEATEKTFCTATFKVEGEAVSTQIYTDPASVEVPEIPFKVGYVGAWGEYTLTNGSVTVDAVYTEIDYTQFTAIPVANTDIDLRTANATVSIALPAEFEGYTALWAKVGETNVEATMDGASVGLTVANLSRGESKVTLLAYKGTEYKVAEIAVTVADIVVKNNEDLAALHTAMQGSTDVQVNGVWVSRYYVLAANVDFNGQRWLPGFSNSPKNFFGILDGRGYTLANYYSQYGLCKEIKPGAQIRNIHLKPIIRTNTSKVSGVCLINFGKIENCFVDVSITDAERTVQVGGVVANNEKGVISNCIVTISKFVSTTAASWIGDVNMSAIALTKAIAGQGSENNCYAINKVASEQYLHVNDMYGDTVTNGLYNSATDFFTGVTELPSANGWNSYWKIENGGLYFNGAKVL